MKTPYRATDKTIAYLNKQYGKLFRRLTAFDELNVIQVSHEIYSEAYDLVKREAARLADTVYRKNRNKQNPITFDPAAWVLILVLAYNPVTKYIFENEIERKRARFAEGVISSDTPAEEVALAKRLLAGTNAQFMDDLTHETMIQAFKDNGATHVRWVTAPDDRRCKECASMHGKIYPIENIPAKPHIHCRCWVEEA